jgi:hypothetical protein
LVETLADQKNKTNAFEQLKHMMIDNILKLNLHESTLQTLNQKIQQIVEPEQEPEPKPEPEQINANSPVPYVPVTLSELNIDPFSYMTQFLNLWNIHALQLANRDLFLRCHLASVLKAQYQTQELDYGRHLGDFFYDDDYYVDDVYDDALCVACPQVLINAACPQVLIYDRVCGEDALIYHDTSLQHISRHNKNHYHNYYLPYNMLILVFYNHLHWDFFFLDLALNWRYFQALTTQLL